MKLQPNYTYEYRFVSEPHRVIFQDGKNHDYRKVLIATTIRDPESEKYVSYIPYEFDLSGIHTYINTKNDALSITSGELKPLKEKLNDTLISMLYIVRDVWSNKIVPAEDFTAHDGTFPIIDKDLSKNIDIGFPDKDEIEKIGKFLEQNRPLTEIHIDTRGLDQANATILIQSLIDQHIKSQVIK